MASLTGELQSMVDPICDRYHGPGEMNCIHPSANATVRIGASELMGLRFVGTLVGVVLSVVGALLGGGGGVALIATGPVGLLAGAAIGAVVAAFGWPAVSDMLLSLKLPRAFRWMNVQKRLTGEKTRKDVRDALIRELSRRDGPFATRVTEGFTQAFQQYLYQTAQEAEIPIQ
jgi:hypothetical protein